MAKKETPEHRYMVYATFSGDLKRHAFNIEPEDINAKLEEYKNAGAVSTGFRHMPVKHKERREE